MSSGAHGASSQNFAAVDLAAADHRRRTHGARSVVALLRRALEPLPRRSRLRRSDEQLLRHLQSVPVHDGGDDQRDGPQSCCSRLLLPPRRMRDHSRKPVEPGLQERSVERLERLSQSTRRFAGRRSQSVSLQGDFEVPKDDQWVIYRSPPGWVIVSSACINAPSSAFGARSQSLWQASRVAAAARLRAPRFWEGSRIFWTDATRAASPGWTVSPASAHARAPSDRRVRARHSLVPSVRRTSRWARWRSAT